jgi:catechol 2,3-dioxygenase-like lactoylglutathione lyase family enzyme
MTRLAWATLALGIAVPPAATGGRPDWYGHLASVHWVVRDLEAVKRTWTRLGFPATADFGEVELPVKWRGAMASARLRVAVARIAGLEVYWLQPLDAGGPYADFLKRRGEGVVSLNHAAPTAATLDVEVGRLEGLGVPVLQSSDVDTDGGRLRIVHMDTTTEGKFALGLVHGTVPGASGGGAPPPFPLKMSHVGFVVRDLKALSSFWSRLGLPPLEIDRPILRDRIHRGRPGSFDQELAWHRHGAVGYEWIRSLSGPTVYDEFTAAHGEGLHHLAFEVPDLEPALASWRDAGFEVVQSGAWGEAGKPGSGRYVYLDTSAAGGVYVELLSVQR